MGRPQQKRGSGRAEPAEKKSPPQLAPVRGKATDQGPLAFDRLIHERLRLGIVSALAVNESLTFNDLKKLNRTTDGNLSVHARKLEEAKLHHVHQVVRGTGAADAVFDHPGRPACSRAVPRPHGSLNPADARPINVRDFQSSPSQT